MNKLTYEFVKSKFEEEGYSLVSTTYTSNNTKLDFVCDKGHSHHITWNKWSLGRRCFYCRGPVKPTFEEIRTSFVAEGYTLLSTEYIDAKTKLDYICPEGHRHSIVWNNWQQGQRCYYCNRPNVITIDQVRESFASEGYTLVSKLYVNDKTKLDFICPQGHEFSITWNGWKSGNRCLICYRLFNWGPNHPNWRDGISFVEYCPVWKDKEYKYSIRERDGHRCLNPYCKSKHPEKLNIHHINYDKKDCHFKNLITVCHECNIKANSDRDWHQDWYQAILYRRYGYTYKDPK